MSNYIKRKFKATIVEDFITKWLEAAAIRDNVSIADADRCYNDNGVLDTLHQRISGKVVTINHCSYHAGEDDYFEEIDDNFVIFSELFTEIEGEE